MKQLYLVFRRLDYRNGYGLWIGQMDGQQVRMAKPLQLEFEEPTGDWALPHPTLEITGLNAQEAVEKLAHDMQLSGVKIHAEPNADGARLDHIKDLRSIIFEVLRK